MTRRYDSTRRRQAAQETREAILRAAMKLHWEGIMELEPLAQEAGCSLATVRKHFPTKEILFGGCTRAFGDTLEFPDPAAIAEISDPGERTTTAVAELCRLHEAMFGYAWHSAYQRKDSPTLDAVMEQYEALTSAIVAIIAPKDRATSGLLRGLLDFLSYRAIRLSGGLSPEETCKELTTTVQRTLGANVP